MMTQDEATAFVIKELGRHRNRNDILMTLCEQGGMSWKQAQQFVGRVESRNKRAITAGQSPFLMVISLVLILLGVGGILYGAQFILSLGNFFERDIVSMVFSARSGYFAIGALFTGLGSFGGGLYGFIKTAINWMREE